MPAKPDPAIPVRHVGAEHSALALDADFSSVLTPTSPVHLSDTVTERLRRTIVEGRFSPGDRLREERLAEALDVSRGPIRDALRELEREGLVVRRRNRGAIVASLSRADVEEVYSLRLAIEPLVCAWGARNASEQDWLEMGSVIAAYSQLTTTTTPHEAADADLRFHDVVYRAAGHRRVQRLWQDLRPQVYIFLLARKYVGTPEFREIMIANHELILSAIRDRDAEAARRTAMQHVEASYRRVIADFDQLNQE